MDVLRGVVDESSTIAFLIHQSIWTNHGKVNHERTYEGRDQSGRRSQSSLVHIGKRAIG